MEGSVDEALVYSILEGRKSQAFSIEAFCFPEQIAFIRDESPFKTAVCSRRSGKTISCAADLIDTALNHGRAVCLYITLSRLNAKRIIWNDLLEINRNYKLGGIQNESELSLKFQNNSVIYLSGAKDSSEIEKFRGLAIRKCYIDECQSFRPYIQSLIDDVISKALFDYNGTLCLIGTPGPVPAGYFYECATSAEWSHHSWTMFENPWLRRKSGKTPQELLERELKRKGITIEDATIQRECFARWVIDTNALVFRYNRVSNDYRELPQHERGEWTYVVGVDLGYHDADAIAVLGFHEHVKKAYLVEEVVTEKQGITALAHQISEIITRYDPLKIVMDTGGLGKKIAEEIQRRYSIPVQAAEKQRKFEYIELLNDAMRTGRFFAKKESRFAQDAALIEWEVNHENPEKLKISEKVHSDICDAVLYAFRESLHYLSEKPPEKASVGSPRWLQEQVLRMEEEAMRNLQRKNENDLWGDYEE